MIERLEKNVTTGIYHVNNQHTIIIVARCQPCTMTDNVHDNSKEQQISVLIETKNKNKNKNKNKKTRKKTHCNIVVDKEMVLISICKKSKSV